MANLLTLIRIGLIFAVVGVWARDVHVGWWQLDLAMVPLLAWAIFMDAVDGWVARARHEESDAGALFDIAGDRVVELVLWVFFAIRRNADGVPFVPYWVPLVIIARTVLTDFVRSVAFGRGRTPFGETTMQNSAWAKQLTSSRWSRALYGGMKAVAFCALGALLAAERVRGGIDLPTLELGTNLLVYATAILCVIRGVPVLWDGRKFVLDRS